MGRWLDKIKNIPKDKLSKPTKPSSVSFVSGDAKCFQKKIEDCEHLYQLVTTACSGLDIPASYVINKCLVEEDKADILSGDISYEGLKQFMTIWNEEYKRDL